MVRVVAPALPTIANNGHIHRTNTVATKLHNISYLYYTDENVSSRSGAGAQ
jgi:hypothetical protein